MQKEKQRESGTALNAEKDLQAIHIIYKPKITQYTMAQYKCFNCGKKITSSTLEKRFVCPSCGSRIFYKPRTKMKTIKAI